MNKIIQEFTEITETGWKIDWSLFFKFLLYLVLLPFKCTTSLSHSIIIPQCFIKDCTIVKESKHIFKKIKFRAIIIKIYEFKAWSLYYYFSLFIYWIIHGFKFLQVLANYQKSSEINLIFFSKKGCMKNFQYGQIWFSCWKVFSFKSVHLNQLMINSIQENKKGKFSSDNMNWKENQNFEFRACL